MAICLILQCCTTNRNDFDVFQTINTCWESCGFDFVWPEMSWGIFSSTCCIFASFCCVFPSVFTSWGHVAEGRRLHFLTWENRERWTGGNQWAPKTMFGTRISLHSFLAVLVVHLTGKLTSGWASWHLCWSQAASPHAETSLKHKHDFIYTVIYYFQC